MMAGLLKKLETGGRRMLFRGLAPGLSSAEVITSIPDGEELGGILLLRQDRIGDMIMTLPLLRKLKQVHPRAGLYVVASESNRIILKHEPGIDVIRYSKSPADFVSSLLQVREYAPEAAVDMHMHDSTTSLIYALASGARWRLHVDRDNRLPYNVRVAAPQDGHIMDAFAGLLSGLGRPVGTDSLDREVSLSREEADYARRFWESAGFLPGDCAAVNISAGGSNREWETEKYASVCRDLLSMGLVPLLVAHSSDRERGEVIVRLVEGSVMAPSTPTILHLAALLRGVVLLVSPDTSVIHLAASMGIPVVGMYLPFDPSLPKWYPWNVENEVIRADDEMSLASVSPARVSDAVRKLVSGSIRSGQ